MTHNFAETTTYDDLANGRRVYVCLRCGTEVTEATNVATRGDQKHGNPHTSDTPAGHTCA